MIPYEKFIFRISKNGDLTPLRAAESHMAESILKVYEKKQPPYLWLLEHDHVYTVGASGASREEEHTDILPAPLEQSCRGGRYTYHGPGQRIGYIVTDIRQANNGVLDIRNFIERIQYTIIDALSDIGITTFVDPKNVGVWYKDPSGNNKKIASIGIKVHRSGITSHGFALNVDPQMSYFQYINPCGMGDDSVISLGQIHQRRLPVSFVDDFIIQHFTKYFGCDKYKLDYD